MLSSQTSQPNLLTLPLELYYLIFRFLTVKDIITLRKICKHFIALTQDRGLWVTIFTHLHATQSLPYSRTEFTAMSTSEAERALFVASKTEASFLQPRKPSIHWFRSSLDRPSGCSASGNSWQVLAFLSDCLLLSVDSDGCSVIVWDTPPHALSSWKVSSTSSSPWAHYTLQTFVGYVEHSSKLYIADMHTHEGHRSVVIHSVSIPGVHSRVNENHDRCLHWEAEFPLAVGEFFVSMDPYTCRAVSYSAPTSICVVHWSENNRRATISIQSDDFDENWNGVMSLRLCGPYILCFRVRSVEAYPVPTDDPTPCPLPIFRHQFGPVSFRLVSLSRVHMSHRSFGDVYDIFMLSNDFYEGMFHFRIRVTVTPAPAMYVRVLARGTMQIPDALPATSNTQGDMVRQMFFMTWSLGSVGLRGVWVDRPRGDITRRVVAFTTHPTRLRAKTNETSYFAEAGTSVCSGSAVDEGQVPTMRGQVVDVIESYDLRDDVTACAVSEWTGRIALGSRRGTITLL